MPLSCGRCSISHGDGEDIFVDDLSTVVHLVTCRSCSHRTYYCDGTYRATTKRGNRPPRFNSHTKLDLHLRKSHRVTTHRPVKSFVTSIDNGVVTPFMGRFLDWSSRKGGLSLNSMAEAAKKLCLVSSFQNMNVAGAVHSVDFGTFSLVFEVAHLLFLSSNQSRRLL
jgi:hypothetical protein